MYSANALSPHRFPVACVLVQCKQAKFKFDYKMIYDQAKQQQQQQQPLCNCKMQKKYNQIVRYEKGTKTTMHTYFSLTTVQKIQLQLCCVA